MMKIYQIFFGGALLCLVGCSHQEESSLSKAACEQTICSYERCLVWSDKLQRCGTADALRKEEKRIERIVASFEKNEKNAAVVQPKEIKDSLLKLEKKRKSLKREIKELQRDIDSLYVLDSISGSALSAETYLKQQLDVEKKKLDEKYGTLLDSIRLLNLVNKKPLTAIQWVDYNKKKKNKKLEKLGGKDVRQK